MKLAVIEVSLFHEISTSRSQANNPAGIYPFLLLNSRILEWSKASLKMGKILIYISAIPETARKTDSCC